MYPQVVQFETRRQLFDSELQLIRERRRAQASAHEADLERATPGRSVAGALREQGVSAFLVRIVAVLTGAPSHDRPSVREDVLPR